MLSKSIAVLLTTFMRPELLDETVQTILTNWNNRYHLIIANQTGKDNNGKLDTASTFMSRLYNPNHRKVYYYNIPYDCGLSAGRNFLVRKAKELRIEYCLLTADSIQFTDKYFFDEIIDFMEDKKERGIVGFDLEGRPEWERDIELVPNQYFWLKKPTRPLLTYKYNAFKPCDIIRNFFLAKTQCLFSNPWDEHLKLCEHEDFFWRLKKNSQYKVFFTNSICGKYKDIKPVEYNRFRQRMYQEFVTKLKTKYNLTGWVKYEQ